MDWQNKCRLRVTSLQDKCTFGVTSLQNKSTLGITSQQVNLITKLNTCGDIQYGYA